MTFRANFGMNSHTALQWVFVGFWLAMGGVLAIMASAVILAALSRVVHLTVTWS